MKKLIPITCKMKKQIEKLFSLLLIVLISLYGCNDKNNIAEPLPGDVILEETVNVGFTPAVFSVANKISVAVPPGVVTNGAKLIIEQVL